MGATQTDNVVNAQFDRLHIWHAGTHPVDQHSQVGQSECDCQCDCACPEPLLAAEGGIHPALVAAGAGPLPLAAHVFTDQIDACTYLIPPRLSGVLVCETRALEHLRTRGATTPALQRLAALLIDAGALAFPAAAPQPHPAPQLSEALTAWISLSEACSLACAYCYVPRRPRAMLPHTAIAAVQAVFRSAQRHAYPRVRLKYAGGEPTLNFRSLLAAQAEAERLAASSGIGCESVLLTNGLHLSEAMIAALAAHSLGVMVSLDGLEPVQDRSRPAFSGGGSFRQVEQTLQRLQAAGFAPHISVTVTAETLDGLLELVGYLIERDLRFSLNFYRPGGAADRLSLDAERLADGLRQAYAEIERRLPAYALAGGLTDRATLAGPHAYTCQAGRSYLVIDAGGGVAACQMDSDRPITSIAAPDPLGDLRRSPATVQNLPVWEKECAACEFASRCTGGCPRQTTQHARDPAARSQWCQVYQQILPQAARLEALRLLHHTAALEISA